MTSDQTVPAPDSVAELLELDHRRLDAILVEAKRAMAAADLPQAAARFSEFRTGLERHIAAEEEVLFPAFDALSGGSGSGPIRVMRMEHAELRALMGEIAGALEGSGVNAHTTPLASLTARIYAHNGKEERILYPATDQAARDAGALEDLVRRLRAFLTA